MSKTRDLSKLIPKLVKNTDTNSGVFVRKNEQTITANLVIAENENAMMTGPITVGPTGLIKVEGYLSIV